jgi:drug/metabolite transporter (DMT)-like permease
VQHSFVAERVVPAVFVVIWSTGFITARLVAGHAEPLTFLLWRYVLATSLLALFAVATRAAWPRDLRGFAVPMIAGTMIHGVYLGTVFWSVSHGLPAGVSALLASLQPLFTGLLAGPLLGERVSPLRWAGIGLGGIGALMVLAPKLGVGGLGGIPALPAAVCFVGTIGITLGTLFQKRYGVNHEPRTATALQYVGAFLVTLPVALVTESGRFDLVAPALAGLLWAVFGLSIGAISLLLFMIRRGAVAAVASLFYLVPALASLMSFFLFDETLTIIQVAGMAVAVVGVALASRG